MEAVLVAHGVVLNSIATGAAGFRLLTLQVVYAALRSTASSGGVALGSTANRLTLCRTSLPPTPHRNAGAEEDALAAEAEAACDLEADAAMQGGG